MINSNSFNLPISGQTLSLTASTRSTQARARASNQQHSTKLVTPCARDTSLKKIGIRGKVPEGLTGTYVRNGPNFKAPSMDQHFFGRGMLHSVNIAPGGKIATYQSKGLVVAERGPFTELPSVSVVVAGNTVMAAGELGLPKRVQLEDLKTLESINFDGLLGKGNFSGHPKKIADDCIAFVSCTHHEKPFARIVETDISAKKFRSKPIELQRSTLIHDFASTPNFYALIDQPIKLSLFTAAFRVVMGTIFNQGLKIPFDWKPEHENHIHLVPKDFAKSDIRIPVETFGFFHFVNGFEADEKVYLDVIAYDSIFENGPSDTENPSYLTRYEVDPQNRTAQRVGRGSESFEMPIINSVKEGKDYDYCYGTLKADVASYPKLFSSGYGPGLVKCTMTSESFPAEEFNALELGYGVGEFTFVPNPVSSTAREDDGFLIGYALDLHNDTSELWILNAQDISAGPVAQLDVGQKIPFGYHGAWRATA